VTSVVFEEVNSPLTQNPASMGGGQRIFPDKNTPVDGFNRRIVRVKATLDTASNPDGYKVIFKAFDVDDPTDDAIIDVNGVAGNDNRPTLAAGNPGTMSANTTQPGTSSEVAVLATGIEVVAYLTVTMQPGNNVVVAATTSENMGTVTIDGTGLKDSTGASLPTAEIKRTELLTTWRRLHVEADSMGYVAGNKEEGQITAAVRLSLNLVELRLDRVLEDRRFQPGTLFVDGFGSLAVIDHFNSGGMDFVTVATSIQPGRFVGQNYTLYDDDNFNNNSGPLGDIGEDVVALADTFAKIQESVDEAQNIFAPAYVMPIRDGGGNPSYDNSDIFFNLNVVETSVAGQINLGRESDSNEADDFWVVYIQIAYQGSSNRSHDPNFAQNEDDTDVAGQTSVSGVTNSVTSSAGVPRGGLGSLIYVETLTDYFRYRQVNERGLVVAHEIGHQFGIAGHRPTDAVMKPSVSSVQSTEEKLVPDHINIIRWRVKSPGY
jgi:hypothetical protein